MPSLVYDLMTPISAPMSYIVPTWPVHCTMPAAPASISCSTFSVGDDVDRRSLLDVFTGIDEKLCELGLRNGHRDSRDANDEVAQKASAVSSVRGAAATTRAADG